MSKKTLALIVALVLVTVVLLVVAVKSSQQQQGSKQPAPVAQRPTPTPVAHTLLSISPNPLTAVAGINTASVNIDTSIDNVTGVQLEIAYDPKVLTNVTIKPGTFFTNPNILLTNVNKTSGRVTYVLGITPAQQPVKGTGTVATLSFSVRPGVTESQTQITLLPKSLVSARGVNPSVLKMATGTTVMLPQHTGTTNNALPSKAASPSATR